MHLGNWEHARPEPRSDRSGLNRNIRTVVTVMVFESNQTLRLAPRKLGCRCVCVGGVVEVHPPVCQLCLLTAVLCLGHPRTHSHCVAGIF